jgi:hypothetical protein
MIFGYFTLLVAIIISAVAAYYSIVGLTAIFAAAVIPVIIMGAALEVGKITAALWLKINWSRANWIFKIYLVPAVAFLMLLTSMGIFGFLSKAHTDQAIPIGDTAAQVSFFNEKIDNERETIANARSLIKQLDDAVLGIQSGQGREIRNRDGTVRIENPAERALQVRRQQARDRAALTKTIEEAQSRIVKLQEEKAPIEGKLRTVEAEVGPIKYVAALIYGDNPNANLLERAVRWVMILIVAVFDPLALVLILAAQQSIRWARDEKSKKQLNEEPSKQEFYANTVIESRDEKNSIKDFIISPNTHSYLYKQWQYANHKDNSAELKDGWIYKPPIPEDNSTRDSINHVENNIPESNVIPVVETVTTKENQQDIVIVEKETIKTVEEHDHENEIAEAAAPMPKPKIVVPETYDPKINKVTTGSGLTADNDSKIPREIKAHFGIAFPERPEKGEVFLRVDYLPSKLYKFNGSVWIEIDKSITDSYVYNEEYIKFLIIEIEQGRVDLDDLSNTERDQISNFLSKNESSNHPT